MKVCFKDYNYGPLSFVSNLYSYLRDTAILTDFQPQHLKN